MASEYMLRRSGRDSHQASPTWVVAFYPFKHWRTWDYVKSKTRTSQDDPSFSGPVTLSDVFIVERDCFGYEISQMKGNHLQSASARFFHNSDVDISTFVKPGDWVSIWSFNNRDDAALLINRLRKGLPTNYFTSGWKFLGRVQSFFLNMTVNADSGTPRTIHEMQATGFSELDSMIYYNAAVQRQYKDSLPFLEDLGTSIDAFLTNSANGIDPNKALPTWLRILLGLGPSPRVSQILQSVNQTGEVPDVATGIISPNQIYMVPAEIGQIIGVAPSGGKTLTYNDILHKLIGVHKYSSTTSFDPLTGTTTGLGCPNEVRQGFLPELATSSDDHVFVTKHPLVGAIAKLPTSLDCNTIWGILNQYLCAPVNEMYTTIRVGTDGKLYPTLVARQIPFSPPGVENSLPLTYYLELPRWVVDPGLIKTLRVGRSDALRLNYCHVTGWMPPTNDNLNPYVFQWVNSPPKIDFTDIQRNGLRIKNDEISVLIRTPDDNATPEENPPITFWNSILADAYFMGHLWSSGTVELYGIQEPIAVGDNIVVNNAIYHIEGVTHRGVVSLEGHRSFTTMVVLSHGVALNSDLDGRFLPVGFFSGDDSGQRIYTDRTQYSETNSETPIHTQKPHNTTDTSPLNVAGAPPSLDSAFRYKEKPTWEKS